MSEEQSCAARYRIWPGLVYPMAMVAAIGLFGLLKVLALPLLVCTYAPVLLGAGAVTFFEHYLPYRRKWQARSDEVWNDALFMVTVQMVLPKALGFLVAVTALQALSHWDLAITVIWPHQWHIGLQVVLMVLIADFFRYWLHRFSHELAALWRFHAVHHSPPKLYWMNVGRFHPIEKTLQFLVDALPFIIVGVSGEVLALYFVFYAVNGFFQHCNIELRMGVLNYLISGPQLHRWHHSRKIEESNTNYGNNIILWDLAFGTFFFPRDRQVDELGLINGSYPLDYVSQISAPFSGDIDKQDLPLRPLRVVAVNVLLRARMLVIRATLYRSFVRVTRRPDEAQQATLRSILIRNRDTEFGRKHGFSSIRSHKEFKERVPVQDYDVLRPLIERQEKERTPVLTASRPFMYNRTSGTTGSEKYIPVLPETIESLRRTQKIIACIQYQTCPEAFVGRLLGIVSPAIEGRLETGTPYGSASGHVYKSMPALARSKYVLPPEVFEIGDYGIKYYVIARLAAEQTDITYLGSANPSTFHKLIEVVNQRYDDIVADIASGQCRHLEQLDGMSAAAIQQRLRPNPERSSRLVALRTAHPVLRYADLWPGLGMVTTWTGGSCGISLEAIRRQFPERTFISDLGYLASELRGTIAIEPDSPAGVPTLHENFFEFVERDAWENGDRHFLTLGELCQGKEYYLFVTTPAGLYRYDMNDIVRVAGRLNETPLILFVQKGRGVTNITGEKLHESQLITSMGRVRERLGIVPVFYQMLADEEASRYALYLETAEPTAVNMSELAAVLDESLQEANMEYATKRAGDRLKPPVVYRLKAGTVESYRNHYLQHGQREGQFKPLILQYKRAFTFAIGEHVNE